MTPVAPTLFDAPVERGTHRHADPATSTAAAKATRPARDQQRCLDALVANGGRFASKLAEGLDFQGPGGCWIWTRSCNSGGYGKIKAGGKTVSTHRLAYELLVGPIPEGMTVDHLCRVTRCANPSHFEIVTAAENSSRSMSPCVVAGRENRCPQGHPLDETNTYVSPSTGKRQCRTCKRDREAVIDAEGQRRVASVRAERGGRTSRFRGVSLHRNGRWTTYISIDGKNTYVGSFADEESAARAYDEAARTHRGPDAATNFGGAS